MLFGERAPKEERFKYDSGGALFYPAAQADILSLRLGPISQFNRSSTKLHQSSFRRKQQMRTCAICGKRPSVGNNVSHANNKTKRQWEPNLQEVRAAASTRGRQTNPGLHAMHPERPGDQGRSRRPGTLCGRGCWQAFRIFLTNLAEQREQALRGRAMTALAPFTITGRCISSGCFSAATRRQPWPRRSPRP